MQVSRAISTPVLVVLGVLTLAAGYVRVAGLSGFAFSPDESLIANISLSDDWGELFVGALQEPHPPLRYFALRAMGQVSRDPMFLRGFALLPGIALIPVLFLLGRRVSGTAAGLSAAWFGAFAQAATLLSGVVRAYSFAVLCVAGGLYFAVAHLQDRRRAQLVGFSVCFTLAVLASYTATIPLLAIAGAYLIRALSEKPGGRPWGSPSRGSPPRRSRGGSSS